MSFSDLRVGGVSILSGFHWFRLAGEKCNSQGRMFFKHDGRVVPSLMPNIILD
jgi:hypothetical protein